jgi:hypothetical protein
MIMTIGSLATKTKRMFTFTYRSSDYKEERVDLTE